MTTTTITVSDMHCAACHNKIRNVLKPLGGISQLQFNPVRRQVHVTHNNNLNAAALLTQIEQAGFRPSLVNASANASHADRLLLKRLGVAGLAMMQVMMVHIALYAGAFQGMQAELQRLLEFTALLFCIPVVSYAAVPFFSHGLNLRRYGVTMDTPIALAITIAFLTSLANTWRGAGEVYYDSVVMFAFLMLAARYIDQRLRQRLRVQDSLLAALPRRVCRLRQGRRQSVDVDRVNCGDVLWINQGEQLPADGRLLDAQATLDEALLSGEAAWRNRSEGELLYAGTFNRGPALRLRVSARPEASRLAHIDQLANNALQAKQGLARLADQVARVFIPGVLTLAALTFAVWWQLDPAQALPATLAVLVVSCPCALSLATPAALTAALVKLRQLGVMVKNPRALELPTPDTVYIDKTGTLTEPAGQTLRCRPLPGYSPARCLQLAAALQRHTTHPLAEAFLQQAARQQLTAAEAVRVQVVPGAGVRGEVEGQRVALGSAAFCDGTLFPAAETRQEDAKQVYLTVDGRAAAVFSLHNPLRADAPALIEGLHRRAMPVTLLSGDTDRQCAGVARRLGISYHAGALPEDKQAHMSGHAKQTRSGTTLYLGDGLNDLPALASADISIAMAETPDLVKSKADINLLTPRLTAVLDLLAVSRFSRRIMRQNLTWALLYNLAAIPMAACGLAPPWLAALGMSASSLLVMANACRTLGYTPTKEYH